MVRSLVTPALDQAFQLMFYSDHYVKMERRKRKDQGEAAEDLNYEELDLDCPGTIEEEAGRHVFIFIVFILLFCVVFDVFRGSRETGGRQSPSGP